ncbi:SipW-dependent-type signal peptide-containing protein [Microbacterium sp. G2-8]|uniref:SipW-dependent-type signal peptide-containing protein n=1 Tax=Microbacterium sp. G2-8 TaxID=2842454 RepID=UPI001C8ADD17|nr:SipW-dependent-type signal peptide-containing protein [Microbacterium sp. G2-8]
MNSQSPTSPEDRTQRRRKLLAITAGGLVLGVGAAVTLAAWTDTEVAVGDFAAGQFALESSTNGTTFTDTTPPENALTLSFDELAQNLSPDDQASAVYAVPLDQASSYQATVAGSVSATGSAADNLTYTVQQVTDIAGGTTVGGALVTGEAVTAGTTHEGMFTLDALDEIVYLKVSVSADSDLGQGETASVTWNLTGTSGESLS